jgi:hypothetical protein
MTGCGSVRSHIYRGATVMAIGCVNHHSIAPGESHRLLSHAHDRLGGKTAVGHTTHQEATHDRVGSHPDLGASRRAGMSQPTRVTRQDGGSRDPHGCGSPMALLEVAAA